MFHTIPAHLLDRVNGGDAGADACSTHADAKFAQLYEVAAKSPARMDMSYAGHAKAHKEMTAALSQADQWEARCNARAQQLSNLNLTPDQLKAALSAVP